jgi:hypothetical protein
VHYVLYLQMLEAVCFPQPDAAQNADIVLQQTGGPAMLRKCGT